MNHLIHVFVAVSCLVCCVAASRADMTLYLLKDPSAVCLDGTPGGFYFLKAATPTNNWQLYFEGGGWCYSPIDCYARSLTSLGSSLSWPPTAATPGGLLSTDCNINPDFCNYNRVYMKYCDGNSFSGTLQGTFPVNASGAVHNLYFRGKSIIDATLQYLYDNLGFASAEAVALTGCSAGGLATYLHADYVAQKLPASVRKYGALPISGFFLRDLTVEAKPVYSDQIQAIFSMSAAGNGGLNAACLADHAASNSQWLCNFAQETYRYIASPVFVLNSVYDSWSLACILTSEPVPANVSDNGWCSRADGWKDCSQNYESCNDLQIARVNAYGHDTPLAIQSSPTWNRSTNGGFLDSCQTHCAAQSDPYYHNVADPVSNITMQQAVSRWWQALGSHPSSMSAITSSKVISSNADPAAVGLSVASSQSQSQWVWPCYLNPSGGTRSCNPTCQSARAMRH